MADETNIAASSVAPAAPADTGGAVSQPSVTPAAPAASAATVADVTALGSEPAVETPVPEVKPAEVKPAEAKLAEGEKPVEGEKPAEEKPAEVVLPTFEPFKLPEGVQLDSEKLGEFSKDLAEFETSTKADHASVQAFGQKLMDKYVASIQESNTRLSEYYLSAFEKQRNDWKEAFEKDPEIGGKRQETTIKSAVDAIKKFGGTTEQQTALREFYNKTGTGNNPNQIRLIANMKAEIDRLSKESATMVPGRAPASTARSKVATRYGSV